MTDAPPAAERLRRALEDPDASARLRTALAAGTRPDPAYAGVLVARCAIEGDFFVRDMLTWALTRHPADVTVPLLLDAVRDGGSQARSQALHTLSKIRDPRGFAAVTPALLADPDDRVARSAWRAAVLLAPADARERIAAALVTQLGRGDREVRRSLSRALVDLGGAAVDALADAAARGDAGGRLHAVATQRLRLDPAGDFDSAVLEAEHMRVLAEARDQRPEAGRGEAGHGEAGQGEAGQDPAEEDPAEEDPGG